MKKVLIVFGTRPEAIKMAPVVNAFKKSTDFETKVCVTAQHRDMLNQVLEFFDIILDYEKLNEKADIVAYLVAHKEFKGFKADSIKFDFCGVSKRSSF